MMHKRQMTSYSCAAAAFAMVTGIPERECIELCGTTVNGTSTGNVYDALKKLGKMPHLVDIGLPLEECWWLERQKYPILVQGTFKTRYHKTGRPRVRHHTFAVKDGSIYDPSENRVFPLEAYNHAFDSLYIRSMIIVEKP